jgi:hypothetical protein
MARLVRNARLDTKDARAKLRVRSAPYWVKIGSKGSHLGYRRLAGGCGTSTARWRDPVSGKRLQEALGNAGDVLDADGVSVLSWDDAQERARTFFALAGHEASGESRGAGPFTVNMALDAYFADRERRGVKAKGVKSDRSYVDARVRPLVGEIEVGKLTAMRFPNWLCELAEAPAIIRSGRKGERQFHLATTDDQRRQRRVSANRV